MTQSKPVGSLKKQLLLTTFACSSVTLVVVALILIGLFNAHIVKRFDEVLIDQMHDLVAAAEFDDKQQLLLAWRSSTPKFNEPFSGWYWQIYDEQEVMYQSDSLYSGDPIRLTQIQDDETLKYIEFTGPAGQALRAIVQKISFPALDSHFHVLVSGPVANITNDVWQFTWQLACALTLVAFGFLIAIFVQLKVAMQPLSRFSTAIKAIRDGQASHINIDVPSELYDIRGEINNLLLHNSAILERSRLQAANLAHALKNPISVLQNQLPTLPADQAQLLDEQLQKLKQCTHTHLARARLAGSVNQLAALCNVSDTLSELLFSMELLYKSRNLTLRFSSAPQNGFRGDQHDLDELLGNIIDNACKWARNQVLINVVLNEHTLTINIEDDGPGIAQQSRQKAFKAGQRLDETTQGTGLGLNIVQDIVTLYNGSINLYRSSLGGLGVVLTLPGSTVTTMDTGE